ncbi:MAG: monovalent cation/H+ antiporter subunit D family protein [Nitrospinae bacterium]|nr:monovalent cation/H+ antiporter subunit D family protein [Nitrospinota bacterium]
MFKADMLPFWASIVPIIGGIIVPFLGSKRRHHFVAPIVTFITLLIVMAIYPHIKGGGTLETVFNTGVGFQLIFRAEMVGFFIGIIAAAVWFLASIYGVGYLSHTHAHNRYTMFSLLSFGGMLGVVFTGTLFTLYLFFELLSVASVVLVFHEETEDAMRAGYKYLIMGIFGGLVLLFSVIATYHITGTGDLSKVGFGLAGHPLLPYIFWGYIIGFGIKAGMFPVYVWLPSAHPVAPAAASALLSGVMLKAGAYGIFKTSFNIMGVDTLFPTHANIMLVLLILGLITMFLGSALAITQTEIKKMLAYSSVAQIGYIVLGLALFTSKGLTGGLMHIFAHAITKSSLFMCAGAFIHQTGLRQIKDLKGIAKRMPLTMAVFTFGGLSMIGLPPFVGFVSKWYLALGSLEIMSKGHYWSGWGIICLFMLCVSSIMNLIYYGPILIGAWFEPLPGEAPAGGGHGGHDEHDAHGHDDHAAAPAPVPNDDPGFWMMAPLLILAAAVLYFGIFTQAPLGMAAKISAMYLH